MVAARIVAPHTKLATTRWWHTTTLAEDFGVADASEDDLYAAMDWLLARQDAIQKKLAARHLSAGRPGALRPVLELLRGHAAVRWPSSATTATARSGMLQVNYGLLTDARGCPVAVSVYEGNVADSQTLMPAGQAAARGLRHRAAGDGGRPRHDLAARPSTSCARPRASAGSPRSRARRSARWSSRGICSWGCSMSAICSSSARPDYPGERLVACRNPELAKLRAHKREELLAATERNLDKIKARVDAGKLAGRRRRSACAWARSSTSTRWPSTSSSPSASNAFTFARKRDEHRRRGGAGRHLHHPHLGAARRRWTRAECVRNYKALANVERAFRSLKTVDLKVRPIHHRTADRVRAHIFLCMLAYYVEWHMREAWRELMFADTDQQAKATRDPVAPAKRSQAALAKVATPHARTTARRRTASRPCSANSPPSCATPAARPTPGPMRRPSRSSPRPTRSNSAHFELIQQIQL